MGHCRSDLSGKLTPRGYKNAFSPIGCYTFEALPGPT
jgi:hypothetical protein